MRRWFWGVSVTGLILLLTSCGTETAGTPTASDGVTPTTTSTRSAPTTESTTPSADSVKPCDLLSTPDAARLGITSAPRPKKAKGTSTCLWRVEKPVAAESYTIDITHQQDRGLKDLVSSETPTPVNVGGHEAVQAPGISETGCVVALSLTPTSRVDVYVTGGNQGRMCAPALEVAKIIDPELP